MSQPGPRVVSGARAWLRRRPVAAAAILYAVLSLLMFCQGLAPGRTLSSSDRLWTAAPWNADVPAGVRVLGSNPDMGDSVYYYEPFLRHTRATLPHVPLWNPQIMGGRPYVANVQSAVFSVFSLPAYLLPFWHSLALIAALKLFVASLGTYLLGRALGMRFAGALLAGLVFGFSLWMVTWDSFPTAAVWAFLPWLCLMTERLLRRPDPLSFVGLAVVVALQYFAGHPESSAHVLIFASLFCVMRVLSDRPRRARAVGRPVLVFVCAVLAGTALAAVVLVPFAELLAHSTDAASRAKIGPIHQPTRYLLGVFLHDYWGRPTHTGFEPGMEQRAYYVGALTLMLAAAALVLRPRLERVVLAGLGLGALAVAVGLPPVFRIVTRFPVLSSADNSRLAVIFVFCAALLAGWGLDDLARSALPARHRRVVLGICTVLFALPVVVMAAGGTLALSTFGSAVRIAWGFVKPPANPLLAPGGIAHVVDLIRFASLLEWAVLAGAAAVLVILRLRGRLAGPAFAALAIGLVTADLFKAGMGWNPAIPIEHARPPATNAIRFLQARRPARFVGLDSTTPLTFVAPLPANVGMTYGLYDARGYDFPIETRNERLWRQAIAAKRDCNYQFCVASAVPAPRALHALGLLGVTDLLQRRSDAPLPGLRLVYAGRDARIYSNPYSLPRAFLVDRQSVQATDTRAFAAISSPSFPARAVAVTDHRLPGLARDAAPDRAPAGQARLGTYRPERVVVQTSSARSALLVLTDSYFPGWKARVDGHATPIRRVDYLLRGVSVPAGSHRVEFRYQPASWRAGLIITGFALLALAATALIGWRRRRRLH